MSEQLKSTEYECNLLGSLMIDPALLDEVEGTGLKAGDFIDPRRGRLFAWLTARIRAGDPVSMIFAVEEIGRRSDARQYPDLADIARYGDNAETLFVEHVARQIVGLSFKRRGAALLRNLLAQFARSESEPHDLLSTAERALQRLAGGMTGDTSWSTGNDLAELMLADLIARDKAAKSGETVGVPWGVDALDRRELDAFSRLSRVVPAMEPGRLYMLAARPAMGKSSLVIQVLLGAAQEARSTALFNLEMERDGVGRKLISLLSGVHTAPMRDGTMTDREWAAARHGLAKLSDLPLFLDTTPAQTIEQISSKARRLAARLRNEGRPLQLLAVDYAQLLRCEASSSEQRNAAVSQGLLALGKELGVPVLALAQLNRDCEKRNDKRPQLSDLRGSGQWEQDAHAICFLYRDAYYNPMCGHNETEFIIAKWRDFRTGTIRLDFQPATQRFGLPQPRAVHA